MAFWLQPASARDLFDMYLTRWPAVFLSKAVGVKDPADLPGETGAGSAGVWVSVQGHWLITPIGFGGFGTLSALLQVRLALCAFEAIFSSVIN